MKVWTGVGLSVFLSFMFGLAARSLGREFREFADGLFWASTGIQFVVYIFVLVHGYCTLHEATYRLEPPPPLPHRPSQAPPEVSRPRPRLKLHHGRGRGVVA
jgi:hypothetical protein